MAFSRSELAKTVRTVATTRFGPEAAERLFAVLPERAKYDWIHRVLCKVAVAADIEEVLADIATNPTG